MRITKLTGVIGAELQGVDLARPSDAEVAEVRRAVVDHQVVVVRDQTLGPAEQVAFSRRLGPAGPVPFVEPMAEHPEVIRVLKVPTDGDGFNFGGAWHSDFSFQPEPPSFTVLHAVDVPAWGGDTVWASMVAAHDTLDDRRRERYEATVGVHTATDAYGPELQGLHDQLGAMTIVCDADPDEVVEHPLVAVHPESGRHVLFFNSVYCRDLRGPGIEPDRVVDELRWLHHHSTDVRFTYRHRWRNGDVAIWDNRSTQHLAVNDYPGQRRELHRTTVAGTRPVGVTRGRATRVAQASGGSS